MRWFGRRTTVIVAAALVAAGCSSGGGESATTTAASSPTAPATTASPASYVLAYLDPGPGALAPVSQGIRAGLDLAIADINTAGGVSGETAGVVTQARPAGVPVTAQVTSALATGAKALIGPVSSSGAIEAIPVLAAAGGLACSPSATQTALTAGEPTGSFFRTALPDDVTTRAVVELVNRRKKAEGATGPWTVSIVARDDDYGTALLANLSVQLTAQGDVPVATTYPANNVLFRDVSASVAAQQPKLVVMVTYAEGALLLNNLVTAGVPAASIVGLDGSFDPRLAQRAFPSNPAAANGVTALAATATRDFFARLPQGDQTQVIYAAQAYDCAVVLALASAAAKSTAPQDVAKQLTAVTNGGVKCTTYQDCLNKLNAGEDIDYDGPSGPIALSDQGNPTAGRFTEVTFKDGQMVEVGSVDVNLLTEQERAAQELATASAVQTAALQTVMKLLGFYSGPVTGIVDPATTAAIGAMQKALGVPVTGVFDEATDTALRAKYGNASSTITYSTLQLQKVLTDLGFYTGPIDGRYNAQTVAAVKALQNQLGVPQTGILDAATVQAAYAKGLQANPPPTTVAPTTAAPTTVAPTAPPTEAPTTIAPTAPPTAPPTEAPTTAPPPTTAAPTTAAPTTPPPPSAPASAFAALQAEPSFSRFVQLLDQPQAATVKAYLQKTQLNPKSAQDTPLTVFAPINGAFDKLPGGATFDQLLASPQLALFLESQMAVGLIPTPQLVAKSPMTSFAAFLAPDKGYPKITATASGSGVAVNGALVTSPADVETAGQTAIVSAVNAVFGPTVSPR